MKQVGDWVPPSNITWEFAQENQIGLYKASVTYPSVEEFQENMMKVAQEVLALAPALSGFAVGANVQCPCGCCDNGGIPPTVQPSDSYGDSGYLLCRAMPAINRSVEFPCACGRLPGSVLDAVIHLNDGDRWSREAIADWLDTLDIDLSFNTTEEEKNDEVAYI